MTYDSHGIYYHGSGGFFGGAIIVINHNRIVDYSKQDEITDNLGGNLLSGTQLSCQ